MSPNSSPTSDPDKPVYDQMFQWFKRGYQDGMCLALWRLHDFLLLYEDLRKLETPSEFFRPQAAIFSMTAEEEEQILFQSKSTACFLIGFSALEALLHSIANLALYLDVRGEIHLADPERQHFLEIEAKVNEKGKIQENDRFVRIKEKLASFPIILARNLEHDSFTLDKGGSPEWNYLLRSIRLRDSIIHAKAKFEGEYEIGAKILAPPDRTRELLQGYTWCLGNLIHISQRIDGAYEPIKELLRNYSERLSLN